MNRLQSILYIAIVLILTSLIVNHFESSDDKSSNDDIAAVSSAVAATPTPLKISEKKFRESCHNFSYKKIARNPEKYIGKNFKLTVQIFSTADSGDLDGYDHYYKAYTDDGSGSYYDHMIYLMDYQDKTNKSYLKILDGDIVTIYCTFSGMVKVKNFLNDEESEEVGLDIHYADLVKE